MSDGSVIHIQFSTDLVGSSPASSRLLNQLRYRMEMCEWKRKNRVARPTEDPDTWDWDALEGLDREFEMVGLP